MSLVYSHTGQSALTVLTERVEELAQSGGFLTPALRQLRVQNLVVSKNVHRLLYLRLDELADGKPLREVGSGAFWRSFIEYNGKVVAAIESRTNSDGTDRAGPLTEGLFVIGTAQAFEKAAELVENQSRQYTPVVVISIALHVAGLWLQAPESNFDVVLPIPPIERPFQPFKPIPLDQFQLEIAKVAREVRRKLSGLDGVESPTRGLSPYAQ